MCSFLTPEQLFTLISFFLNENNYINADLENVTFQHGSVEENKSEYDFVVSRAVMPLPDLLKLIRKNIKKEQRNALPNGLLCLKGGELQNELVTVKKTSIVFDLKDYFKEDYFDTKKVVYVQIVKK